MSERVGRFVCLAVCVRVLQRAQSRAEASAPTVGTHLFGVLRLYLSARGVTLLIVCHSLQSLQVKRGFATKWLLFITAPSLLRAAALARAAALPVLPESL